MFVPAIRYGAPPLSKRVPFVRTNAGRRAAPTAADEASNTDAPTSKSRRVILAIGLSLFSVTLLQAQAAAQDSANKLRGRDRNRERANLLPRRNGMS
jgi:hypothetical protein